MPVLRIFTRQSFLAFAIVIALGIALFLHFWRIGSVPRGFSVDECSISYNAYCIALTAADEYGTSWPFFLRGIDGFCGPVPSYTVALPIRAFGLEKWVARFPCGLYFLLACFVFSMLLRHWQFEGWLALAGGFMLAVIPWVFPLSRSCTYSDRTAALLALVTGLVLTSSALRRRSNCRAVLAGAVWAFVFYTSQIFYPLLALLAIGCAVVLWRPLLERWRLVLVMTLSALIVSLPFIISVLRSSEGLTSRFHKVSITSESASLREVLANAASRYVEYFSPEFLFISGDDYRRQHTGHGGELYWCLAPLILIGLYVTIRYWRRQASHRIVLVGVLISPVSAALTLDRMHSTRSVYAVVFWLLLAAFGAQWIWQRRGAWRKLLLLLAFGGALEIILYMRDYFGAYQTRDPRALQTEVTDALEYCFAHLGTNQTLYISPSTYNPYGETIDANLKPYLCAHVLFFGKIDPRVYQHSGLPTNTVRLYDGHPSNPGLLLRCNNYYYRLPVGAPGLPKGSYEVRVVPDTMPIPSEAKLVETIPFSGQFSSAQYQVFAIP